MPKKPTTKKPTTRKPTTRDEPHDTAGNMPVVRPPDDARTKADTPDD